MKITIPGELTDLNNYINAERSNRFKASKIKKTETEKCIWISKNKGNVDTKVKVIFTWYCKDQMKDPDNICFAKKFILDGFVKSGLLKNDGWKQIEGFEDKFIIDKLNPRVVIELKEVS